MIILMPVKAITNMMDRTIRVAITFTQYLI